MKRTLIIAIMLLLIPKIILALPNFPEAEGYGVETVGGRYGTPTIYRVTNTNDSGAGSLRAAIEASGGRIIVFTTGGTITLSSNLIIDNPYITIAGQTAPGGGVTINGNSAYGIIVQTHDVVLRYLTIRVGGPSTADGIAFYENNPIDEVYNCVLDHCSVSWATDENISIWYDSHDITLSWNISSEGLNYATHSMGAMIGGHLDGTNDTSNPGENVSFHHNLLAHNNDRNGPYLRGGGYVDIRSNVAYNPGGNNFCYAAQEANKLLKVNIVHNYFKDGPDSGVATYAWRTYYQAGALGVETYVEGNYHSRTRTSDIQDEDDFVYSSDQTVADKDTTGDPNAHLVSSAWSDPPSVTEHDPFDDLLTTLTGAGGAGNSKAISCSGAWSNRRDSIDTRIAGDVVAGTGSIINDESDVEGWISIDAGTACTDTDSDGMPDAFESLTGWTDPLADDDSDGYLNIEEWLNGSYDATPNVVGCGFSGGGMQ